MKAKLSPEASGTLAALRNLRKIKSFSPECADELLAHGLAIRKAHHLTITDKGVHAADRLYSKTSLAIHDDTQSPAETP
jgi:hypothetical protein